MKPMALTVAQVAAELQMHPVTVRRHLNQRLLPGVKVKGEWRVPRERLERHLAGDASWTV